jgi:hypothetical protein
MPDGHRSAVEWLTVSRRLALRIHLESILGSIPIAIRYWIAFRYQIGFQETRVNWSEGYKLRKDQPLLPGLEIEPLRIAWDA